MTEDNVLLITKVEFNRYWDSDQYQFDLAISGVNKTLGETSPSSSGYGLADSKMLLITPAFQGSLERKKEHYSDRKDDEGFSLWDEGPHKTSRMHNTHNVLDESYEPETDKDI
jgi:hypothetical protein